MAISLYNPFKPLDLNPELCFLTGQPIHSEKEQLSVFPEWILDRYSLREKTFTMLGDGNIVKYKDLRIPCAARVIEQYINPLEKEIEQAFSIGYEAVKELPKHKLFLWMGKLVYGVLYHDLRIALNTQSIRGERFSLSPYLENRFRNLHLMLQSLTTPMEFKKAPRSIEVVRVKYSKDVFNYKDETNNLNFSLGMHDFGIVACLQDNGENSIFHQELLKKIGEKILHPIQFEELCGRFIYSNYLLKWYPEFVVHVNEEKVFVEAVPFSGLNKQNLYDPWEDEMFGQVLANYWKPWGIPMSEIVVFPNAPISFLLNDYSDALIEPESISLPF
ncbi:MAG TPA: hypothetical protein VNB90_16960 [Cytophagaceae bacterium]|nr:hypothetical protein [Cytophagaceae bacterium]